MQLEAPGTSGRQAPHRRSPRPPASCVAAPSRSDVRHDPRGARGEALGLDFARGAGQLVAQELGNNVQPLGQGGQAPSRLGRRRAPKPRLKVGVDIDEVLGFFLDSLNLYLQEERGLSFSLADYFVYVFAKVWLCTPARAEEIVHAFFDSQHFQRGIQPVPGALAALTRLRGHCDLVVVTSRQNCIEAPTRAWLHANFPGVFSEVHFGNHWALTGVSRAKSDICREIGVDVLIDDNPRYAEECAQAGIEVLLFDMGYPWSTTPGGGPTHEKILRVGDWGAVERALAALARRLEQP